MKAAEYFKHTRQRPDRARIKDEWIESAVTKPDPEATQSDGRIRRWLYIETEQKYLRVVLLEDGETIHNAFFDRDFKP